jgi:hypothetical protein
MAKANKTAKNVVTLPVVLNTARGAIDAGFMNMERGEVEKGLGAQYIAVGMYMAVASGSVTYGEDENSQRTLTHSEVGQAHERLAYRKGPTDETLAKMQKAALIAFAIGKAPSADDFKQADGTVLSGKLADAKSGYMSKRSKAELAVKLYMALVHCGVAQDAFDPKKGFKVSVLDIVPEGFNTKRDPNSTVYLDTVTRVQVYSVNKEGEEAFKSVVCGVQQYIGSNATTAGTKNAGDKTINFGKACEYIAKHLSPDRKMTEHELKVFNSLRTALANYDQAMLAKNVEQELKTKKQA